MSSEKLGAFLRNRSLDLVAEFQNGYAKGWNFAVRECFRDALDIRMTEVVIEKGSKAKTIWTQGDLFAFKKGDMIYSHRLAYDGDWLEALKVMELAVQVIEATPAQRIMSAKGPTLLLLGSVIFDVKIPNEDKSCLRTWRTFEVRQRDFVTLLRTGIVEAERSQFDLFDAVRWESLPLEAA